MAQERRELEESPEEELAELTALYRGKGLSEATARLVAEELTATDAYGAHLDAERGIDPDDLTNPRHAALASAVAFTLGALLPLLAVLLPPETWRVPVCVGAVLGALAITGVISARLGGANARRAVLRVLLGGALGLAVTYGIGHVFGTAIG